MSGPLDPMPDRGVAMLETLWAPEQDDPSVLAIMRAAADELDEVVAVAEDARDQAWPHRATTLLPLHEAMLRVPVDPSGATLAQRQAAVRSAVQARKLGSRRNWEARMNTVMRDQPWTYEENTPGPGQLTISIPFDERAYNAKQAEALARRITPAHVQIVMRYSQGFIVGVSRVGQDAI
jgi:uncharacterized protein YmfQ (DUF2313 family)